MKMFSTEERSCQRYVILTSLMDMAVGVMYLNYFSTFPRLNEANNMDFRIKMVERVIKLCKRVNVGLDKVSERVEQLD